jgi:hypothetical protein
VYAAGGVLASGFRGQSIAIDGSGNIFAGNINPHPIVAAITNSGAALAPATGFTGATYAAPGATVAGVTSYTGYARPYNTSAGLAIDASGNLWVSNGAATTATSSSGSGYSVTTASVPATNVVQIVGVAAPVQTPLAAAAAAHNLGGKP